QTPEVAKEMLLRAAGTEAQAQAEKEAADNTKSVTNKITAAVNASISAAIQAKTAPVLQKFDRPDDVSCSFSLLAWHETSDEFARRVANDYVGIQVNVRNLNAQNEFLIHDVQIAVDTGVGMRQFDRFKAGRDKLIVRAVAERGKSEDRRNLILNTMQMVGN